MKPKSETVKVVFEGQTHQIDANTLINFLIHYNTIVDLSNKELGDGTKKIVVKVNAVEKGSFIISMELVQEAISALFSSDTISYLANLTAVIGGVFYLHKKLKGKPISQEDTSTLEVEKENSTIIINNSTFNIYNQPVTREAISKSIATIDEDEAVEGLRIDNSCGTAVRIEKKEFKELIYTDFSSEELTPSEKIIIDKDAMLGITRLSFEKGAKWGFVYKGFKINITVKNDELMKHIDAGAKFAKGDYIRVKLEILQKFNPEFRVYENSSYKILEFFGHIQSPDQSALFGEEEPSNKNNN